MRRLATVVTAGAFLGACIPSGSVPTIATASPSPAPPTATAFLPRGFNDLPSAVLSTATAETGPTLPPPTATGGIDLAAASGRLNLLRAEEGLPPLVRSSSLDRAAQERAQSLASSGSLWHMPDGGQGAEVEAELSAAGFAGRVAEAVLSVGIAEEDPLGLVLQALLTDQANREVMLGSQFRLIGLGAAPGAEAWYVVGLLAQEGPTE